MNLTYMKPKQPISITLMDDKPIVDLYVPIVIPFIWREWIAARVGHLDKGAKYPKRSLLP